MIVRDFNIHRIGLVCINHWIAALVLFAILLTVAVVGSLRVEYDRDLPGSWVGKSPELSRFEELDKKLQGGKSNMFILAGGGDFWTRAKLASLQQMHLELAITDGIDSVVSPFTLQSGDVTERAGKFLIPQDLSSVDDLSILRQRLAAHPMADGYLVSKPDDRQTWFLFVIDLDNPDGGNEREAEIVLALDAIADAHTTGSTMRYLIGGLPKAKIDIVAAIRGEFIFYSIAGILVSILIATAYFRSIRFVIIASLSPIFAALLSFGCMGLLGIKMSPLLSAIPSLVLAVSFTDSMHLMSDLRRTIQIDGKVKKALSETFRTVGPACTVASLTTALAMLSLLFADAQIIRNFGLLAAIAVLVAVISLMITIPLLTRVLLHSKMPRSQRILTIHRNDLLGRSSSRIAMFVSRRPKRIAVLGLLLTVLVMLGYFQIPPQYRLGDQLPADSSYRAANHILDRHFQGANPVFVAIDASDSGIDAKRLLGVTRNLRTQLSETFPDKSIISIDSLRNDVTAPPTDDVFDHWVLDHDEIANGRLFSKTDRLSALAFNIQDAPAATVKRVAERTVHSLQPVLAETPGIRLDVTGLPVIMAHEITAMIVEMNWGLFVAFGCVFLLLGYLFQAGEVIALSVAPNLLPVFAAGILVSLTEGGTSLACIVGLTVGFGLSVDNSSHFLNRLMIESRNDINTNDVSRTLVHMGPILMATTTVLVCGLAVTAIGQTPTSRIFGMTCIIVLVFALGANLLLLPALTTLLRRFRWLSLHRRSAGKDPLP